MSKIRMLKDIEAEELKEILFKNEKMIEKLTSFIIGDKMDQQEEYSNLLFGVDWYRYIEYKDNYNSFFLRLKNWEKFIENLGVDYLNEKGTKKHAEILKDIKKYEDEEDEDKKAEFYGIIENECENLLEICENMLHEFEEYPTNDEILEYFIYNEIDFVDYYVNEANIICLDVAYTEYFN